MNKMDNPTSPSKPAAPKAATTKTTAPKTVAKGGDAKAGIDTGTLTVGGLSVAIGTLLYTGFMRPGGWKKLHVGAGLALTGLALWHASQQATHRRKALVKAKRAAREQA